MHRYRVSRDPFAFLQALCAFLILIGVPARSASPNSDTGTFEAGMRAALSSPPIVSNLTYSIQKEGRIRFGYVRYQPDAFFFKSAASLAHLHDDRVYSDTQMAGRWHEEFWSVRGDASRVSCYGGSRLCPDRSGGPNVADAAYRVALEGLSVLFFGTPAWEAGICSWTNHGLTGTGWFGQTFRGQLRGGRNDCPLELFLEVQISESQSSFQLVRFTTGTRALAGLYPEGFSLFRASADATPSQSVANVRILNLLTSAAPLSRQQFMPPAVWPAEGAALSWPISTEPGSPLGGDPEYRPGSRMSPAVLGVIGFVLTLPAAFLVRFRSRSKRTRSKRYFFLWHGVGRIRRPRPSGRRNSGLGAQARGTLSSVAS